LEVGSLIDAKNYCRLVTVLNSKATAIGRVHSNPN
jgi:hypothetical protein